MRKISTLMMLLLTMVAFNVVAQDTISYYGYEADTYVGPHGSLWTNTGKTYVTETVTGDSDGAYKGSGYFKAVVDHTPPNVWDNQSVFQEMPIKDSTCYRFCLRAKATASWSDTTPSINITCGNYNWADITSKYGVQIADEWSYYSLMVYIGNTADLNLTNSAGRYDDTIRFPIHFPTPGTYYLDEVALLESTIAGAFYNNNLVKVDFGWGVDSDTADLDVSKYSVSVGGSAVAVTKAGRYKYVDSDTSYWESAVLLTLESAISQVSGTTVTVDFAGDDDVYYLSDGPYTDDDGHIASFTGEVAFYDADVVDNTVNSIHTKTATLAFDLCPNPVQNELTVTASSIASVSIYDISGKQVQTVNTNSTNSVTIDVADLRSGIYVVRVTDVNGNIAAKKLVK